MFKILLINEINHIFDFKKLLKDISCKIIFADDYNDLHSILEKNTIHLIIINTKICTLNTLVNIFDESNINHSSIPILILEDSTNLEQEEPESLLVFDHIDSKTNKEVIYNKIKFCQQLYNKEIEYDKNIKKLLYTDNLTQLPNRSKLIHDIQNKDLGIDALAIININSFKDLNDFFGHKIGDEIIKTVMNVINNLIHLVNDKVTLYKFPADEYYLANHGLSHKDFQNLIVYILNYIKSELVIIDDNEIDIDATAGITFSPKNNKLVTADLALQEAKKQNKPYLVFYEELDRLRKYENNMIWTKKLKKALKNDNIIVYYQPLVNNETKHVDKYECLVRMYDEDENKIISPFFFLELSKKTNQYKTITKIVIDKAFKEFENLDFEFSINVSYEDINELSFLPFIENRLKKYNLANRVVWEILEDESIKDYDVLINFINNVKYLGCKVAIDDFGSGYSNFGHLLRMDIDYLKIDASLVKNVVTDENSYKVVKTVVEFAKSLKLKTIAEFVENEDIYNITKDLGVTFSQGYYFSAPIPKPSLENF